MDVFSYVQFAMKIVTKMFLINSNKQKVTSYDGTPGYDLVKNREVNSSFFRHSLFLSIVK